MTKLEDMISDVHSSLMAARYLSVSAAPVIMMDGRSYINFGVGRKV